MDVWKIQNRKILNFAWCYQYNSKVQTLADYDSACGLDAEKLLIVHEDASWENFQRTW